MADSQVVECQSGRNLYLAVNSPAKVEKVPLVGERYFLGFDSRELLSVGVAVEFPFLDVYVPPENQRAYEGYDYLVVRKVADSPVERVCFGSDSSKPRALTIIERMWREFSLRKGESIEVLLGEELKFGDFSLRVEAD